jgi:hypothetical protein
MFRLISLAFFSAFVPTLFLVFNCSSGLGLSPDSYAYLYAAENFFNQGSILSHDGRLLTLWPPLYPIFIAVVNLFVGSLLESVVVINVSCMFVAAFVTFFILRDLRVSNLFATLVTLATFINPIIQWVFGHAWSEPLYMVAVLSVLFVCGRVEKMSSAQTGIVFGLLTGAAFLTRYVGVSLLPVALLGILCATTWPIYQRLKSMVLTVVISMMIVCLWVFRNYCVDGTFFGARIEATDTIVNIFSQIFMTFGQYLTPGGISIPLTFCMIAILCLLMLILWMLVRGGRPVAIVLAPAAASIFCYMILFVYSGMTTKIDTFGERFMMPVAVPVVIIIVCAFWHGKFELDCSWKRIVLSVIWALYFFLGILELNII